MIVAEGRAAGWTAGRRRDPINAIVKAELFPTSIRASGIAIPYALTVSIFGGTAPAIALKLKAMGHESWFYYYLPAMIFLSLLVFLLMRDTKRDTTFGRVT